MNTLDLHIENHFTTTYSTNHSLLIVHADQTLAPVQYQLVHESDDAPQDLPLPKKPLTLTLEDDLNTRVATLVSINVNGSKEYLDTVSKHQKAIILDDNLFMLSFFDCKLQLQNLTSDSTITISNYKNKKA